MSVRLRFGAPRSNWIPLGLSSDSIAFDELVSSLPADPLQGIARAALAAAEGRPGVCELHSGVQCFAVRFSPEDGAVLLDVVRRPDRGGEGPEHLVFRTRGTPADVLLPVWRGLHELRGRWPRSPDFWSPPFPDDAVAQLGGLLRTD